MSKRIHKRRPTLTLDGTVYVTENELLTGQTDDTILYDFPQKFDQNLEGNR